MVLTKEELDDQDWWNENVVFVEGNPADGEEPPFIICFFGISIFVSDTSYERLLSVLVGSYYVDVRTLNSEVRPNVILNIFIFLNRFLNFHFHQSSYLRKES